MAKITRKNDITSQTDLDVTDKNMVSDPMENLAEVAELFGGEDAVENMADYIDSLDENWAPEITRIEKRKGKEISETITIIPNREAMRIAADHFMSNQNKRIRLENQIRATQQGYDNRSKNEVGILELLLDDAITSEANAKNILETVTMNNPICCWMRENIGIGPILAAELYAYLDFNRVKNASGYVSYAGLNDNIRPRLSKERAQQIVDEVIGNCDGSDITDEMLMEIAVQSKWSYEYLVKKSTREVKVKAMCQKARLIKCVEVLLEDDDDATFSHSDITQFVNATVVNPSASNDDLIKVAEHFGIPYNRLFDVAVSQKVKDKLAADGGTRSKDQIRKAISVFPYNKTLKMIVWKMATSFVYQSSNPKCFYGKLYKQRLQYELTKNENGDYAEQAALQLTRKKYGKTTEAYKCYSQGKLPKAHITARAMRWTAKVFLNHLYEASWVYYHQSMDYPKYYAIAHMGHYDLIEPAVSYEMLLNKNLPESQRNINPRPVIN